MATVLGIQVKISGDSSKLDKALKKLKKELEDTSNDADKKISKGFAAGTRKAIAKLGKLRKAVFSLKGAVVALAGAFALKQGFDVFFSAINRIRELELWSKTLNLGINNLQSLQFAFRSVGFEADKTTDILKDVNEKIGDALISGGGEFANVLNDLGISLDRFRGLDAFQTLQELSDATANLNAQKRVTIFEALANDASKLLPILDKSGEGIQKLFREFDSLGVKFTQTQVDNAKQFKFSMGTMTLLWESFTSMLSAEIAPAFDPIFTAIKDFIKDAGGMRRVTELVAKAAVNMGIAFLNGLDEAQKAVRAFALTFQNDLLNMSNLVLSFVRSMLDALDAIPLVDLSAPIEKLDKAALKSVKTIFKNVKALKAMKKEVNVFQSAIEGLTAFRDKIGTGADANFVERQSDFTRANTKAEKARATALKKSQADLLKGKKEENAELEKANALYDQIQQKVSGLAEVEAGGGLIRQLQEVAKKAAELPSSAGQQKAHELFKAGITFLETGGQGKGGAGGKIEILITTDEKGIIIPVVKSKELSDKVKVLVNSQMRTQATVNDR